MPGCARIVSGDSPPDIKNSHTERCNDTERVRAVTITAWIVHELSARTAGMKKLPAEKLGREIFSEKY